MEAALLNLIGVALAVAAGARHNDAGTRAGDSGRTVILRCVEHRVPGLALIIERMAADVWEIVKADAISDQERAEHLARLTATITSHGACDRVSVEGALNDPAEFAASTAQRLAAAILSDNTLAASDESSSWGARLQRSLQSLLFSMQSALMASPQSLPAIVGALGDDDAPSSVLPEPKSEYLAESQARLAHETGLSPSLVEALVARQRFAGRPEAAIRATLADSVVDAIELLTELMTLVDKVGSDDALESELLEAAQHVRTGNFHAAQRQLSSLTRHLEKQTSPARLDSPGFAFLPALHAARANLANLDADWREASRLFEHAAQTWPREDRLSRWKLKLRQARQLVTLGMLPQAPGTVLCEAAQSFAKAGGVISERDCPLPWAEANLELGTLLLMLGDRDSKPERYLAAALHFKPALEVFTREKAFDGWARSQIGLAHALRGQGAFQGDVVTLNEAAFAYRASLGILTEAATPELWHEARYCLAETLLRIGEETGEIDPVQAAIDMLLPIRDDKSAALPDRTRTLAQTALGRAMLFLSEQDQDEGVDDFVLTEAMTLLERALATDAAELTALERARGECALGRVHWLLRCGHDRPTHIAKAIAATKRACAIYDHLDDVIAAEALQQDLADMQEEAGIGRNTAIGRNASALAAAIAATA